MTTKEKSSSLTRSTAGVLERVAFVWIVPLFVTTLGLDIATAEQYKRLGGQAGKSYDALVLAGLMQALLTVLLLIRGWRPFNGFRWLLVQMLLVFHALLPNARLPA